MQKITCMVIRTEMCGGGTKYEVLVPVKAKRYQPIACGHIYATVIRRHDHDYYRVDDFLRDEAIDGLPALSDERWNAFHRLEQVAKRLEIRIAKRAFVELAGRDTLPTLWASWTLPNKEHRISIKLNDRNYNRLCA
jgi:hypothetical protein